jgi:3-oxoadipate enol-lactonase
VPTTETGGRAITFEVIGDGPARVVLIAGTGLPGAFWTLAQVPAFVGWSTCLLPDNAGTGGSDPLPHGQWSTAAMALDVAAAMDGAGWTSAHVVGHSLGTAIALQFVRMFPARVSSLSLHGTWSATRGAPHLAAWLEARRATAQAGNSDLWRRYCFFLVSPDHLRDHGFDRGALGRVGALVAGLESSAHTGQYDAGLCHDAEDVLATITVPTLVTVGSDDFVTLPRYGRAVAAAIPGSNYVEFAEAGHMACLEVPEEFNRVQQRFVSALGGLYDSAER